MSACSMTGFGQLLEDLPEGRLSIEVRTLNARGREIAVHAGGAAVPEADLRELAAARFARGKIDITLRLEPAGEAGGDSVTGLIEGLRARIAGRDILLQEALLARVILALEGGPVRRPPSPGPDRVREAVARACELALEHRRREGARMVGAILEVTDRLRGLVSELGEAAPLHARAQRERLAARLVEAGVTAGAVIEPPLARELAQLADRADVNEELARLRAHLDRLTEAMTSDRPIGREVDFLCQELVRESNTIGSKSADAGIAAAVIRLKSGIEQVRELAANLE